MNAIFYQGETLTLDMMLTDDAGAPMANVSKVEALLASECNGGKTSKKQLTYTSSTGAVSGKFTPTETKVLGHRTWLEIMVTLSSGDIRIGRVLVGDCVANEISDAS